MSIIANWFKNDEKHELYLERGVCFCIIRKQKQLVVNICVCVFVCMHILLVQLIEMGFSAKE